MLPGAPAGLVTTQESRLFLVLNEIRRELARRVSKTSYVGSSRTDIDAFAPLCSGEQTRRPGNGPRPAVAAAGGWSAYRDWKKGIGEEMRNLLAKIDFRRILLMLTVATVSAGSGFLLGMWLGS